MDLLQTSFRLLARVRRARAFHPVGASYAGSLELTGDGPLPPGPHRCAVRLSQGVGVLAGWPDLLGVGTRVETADGPVDVLATTTVGSRGWRRLVLRPVRRWHRATLSTLMPWEGPDGTRAQVVLTVDDPRLVSPRPGEPAEHLPVRITWRVATPHRVLQAGLLTLEEVAPDRVDLDPVLHSPPGWTVVPRWLARVRETAYVGSREGRGVSPAGRVLRAVR